MQTTRISRASRIGLSSLVVIATSACAATNHSDAIDAASNPVAGDADAGITDASQHDAGLGIDANSIADGGPLQDAAAPLDSSDAFDAADAGMVDAEVAPDADTTDHSDASMASVDSGVACASEHTCSGMASTRCVGTTQRIACLPQATCGTIDACWSGPCTEALADAAECAPAARVGARLVDPQPQAFSGAYIVLYPTQLAADTSVVGLRVELGALATGSGAAIFGVYQGVVDAHGPHPGALLASTGVVNIPVSAGSYDFPFGAQALALSAATPYWLAAGYQDARNGVVGQGAVSMFYRSLSWDDDHHAVLPQDLSAFYSSKTDGAAPASLSLLSYGQSP